VTGSDASSTAARSALQPLLAGQLRALRTRYLVHGVASTAAIVALAIAVFFALDHELELPLPIRLFHTAVVAGLGVAATLRFVRYPLTRAFGEVDVAVWFERTFPELHQRLVSAVQLQRLAADELRNQSSPMIAALLAETGAAVRALPLGRLFDPRPTRRVAAVAVTLLALLVGGAIAAPATMRAFLLRHLGLAASYPRETSLRIELPPPGQDLQRTDHEGRTELTLPAGADLHVGVLAEGRVPKEVWLDVRARRDGTAGEVRPVATSLRPGARFRHVFRRVAGEFEFHARGGDDPDGDRVVIVRTVSPPQVATITAVVDAPAYTGSPPLEQRGGAIEALVGSGVEIAVTTTMAVRSAAMVFLESGRRFDLAPSAPHDDSGVSTVYRGTFVVEGADRYQIELLADNGLRNPNPGTYPISALQDYAPIGRWLLPDDEAALLLPVALLCVRVEARDDFGLRVVDLVVERGKDAAVTRSMLAAGSGATTAVVLSELLEVRDLLGGAQSTDGLVLTARLGDNKAPQPGTTELPRRIVQIVDEPQLNAAIGRLFRGLREDVAQALDLQQDRRERLGELLATDAPATDAQPALTGIEVGQGRIAAAVERVHRGLMRAFDLHLWNRLEPSQHAAAVVDLWREHAAALREPQALDPSFYRALLARRAAGSLGAMEQCLDPILAMYGIADGLGSGPAPELARTLAEAQVARDAAERRTLLARAAATQAGIEDALRQLLLRLEEWNEYQDLVQEARALRDGQRDLQGRTEDAKGKQ
jgi:hypothetical protein